MAYTLMSKVTSLMSSPAYSARAFTMYSFNSIYGSFLLLCAARSRVMRSVKYRYHLCLLASFRLALIAHEFIMFNSSALSSSTSLLRQSVNSSIKLSTYSFWISLEIGGSSPDTTKFLPLDAKADTYNLIFARSSSSLLLGITSLHLPDTFLQLLCQVSA